MGLYNVVAPCVVGRLHYVRPTTAPIEVDDAVAAPLVEAGSLEPYQPGVFVAPKPSIGFVEPFTEGDDEPPTNPPPPRARGGRRKGSEA